MTKYAILKVRTISDLKVSMLIENLHCIGTSSTTAPSKGPLPVAGSQLGIYICI